MTVLQLVITFVSALVGGAGFAAIINSMHDKWKFKATREAEKEDKLEEKVEKTNKIEKVLEEFKKSEADKNTAILEQLEELKKSDEMQKVALKIMLLDTIRHRGQSYIDAKEVSFDDRRVFHMMHDIYHDGLNGNGDAKLIVKEVDTLPLKSEKFGGNEHD